MAILRDWQQVVVNDFRGPWLTIENSDVPISNALLAQNVDYLPGLVKTRQGFIQTYNPGDQIISMINWLAPSFTGIQSFLVYLAASGSTHTGMDLMTLSNGSVSNLYVPNGNPVGASFAFGGYRIFMATFTSGVVGSDQARVFSNETAFIINGGLDKLFAPPVQYVPAIADTGVGIVTAGVHNIAYILTTRNGFTTQPSPVDASGDFVVTSHTAPGGEQLEIVITPTGTWPAEYISLQIAMTEAGGAQYFLVPGAIGTVPFGSSIPVTVFVNIDDGTLAADGQDATPFFTKLVQSQSGTGPFQPWFIGDYGSRMIYLAFDADEVMTTYVSESNDYQTLSQANNVIYLPGQRQVTCAFVLYNTLYLVGPHWTYATQDTGGEPVTWPAPQLIDGLIGTLSPNGVTVNASQGIAWVADTAGLYLFSGGAYSTRPVSYYQTTDWNRINWSGGGATVQVLDNKENYKVHVLVPLDGATTPNYIMAWDYSRGLDAESVSYSLQSLQNFTPGAIAMIENPLTSRMEEWLAPGIGTTGPIMRQTTSTDPSPYTDNGQPILSTYQTALLPPMSGSVLQHHGDQFRLGGFGNVYVTVLGLDGQTQVMLNPIGVELYPGQIYTRLYHMLAEAASLQISTQDPGAWFQLSQLTHYFTPYVTSRR